ncbi:hypothetical protein [Streptomyces palmae]|uniref:Uncharacterized protein n=1 Tax=Streptomyces palmae TaxID=1701085 RepID=A0A4Z0GLV5_9ACTN|nr:hypothetical protein [Streptomyces palmae]TGA96684.1 hypothetical protein E4099_24040 [Streptomyces palmae]
MAVQRAVKVGPHSIGESVIEERLRERAANVLKKLPEADQAAIIARVKELAKDESTTVSARSYEELVKQVHVLVRQERAKALPQVESIAVSTGAPPASSPKPDQMDGVEISQDTKIKRLGEVRRRLSLVSVQQELGAFRDRGKGVTGFTYKHTEDQKFGIAANSNFLTGGQSGHSYRGLFDEAKTSGLKNDQIAKRLINALTAEGNAFTGLEADARRSLTKIVAVIQGAEFRRSAANPTAAIAALNRVVADPGLDLFETLHSHALFTPEGGSARSQFHRHAGVDQSQEDFKAQAEREYDALAQLVTVNGYDAENEQAFYTGCERIGATSMAAFKKTFHYDT